MESHLALPGCVVRRQIVLVSVSREWKGDCGHGVRLIVDHSRRNVVRQSGSHSNSRAAVSSEAVSSRVGGSAALLSTEYQPESWNCRS